MILYIKRLHVAFRPKGVLITNANYIYAGETVAKAIRLTPDDRHCIVLPLFHANAQYYSTMSALVTGASIALIARFSASSYFDSCIAHHCTIGSLFAAPIRMILAQERRPELRSNTLRIVLTAQNVTAAQLDEWAERFGAPLLQLYGMTETIRKDSKTCTAPPGSGKTLIGRINWASERMPLHPCVGDRPGTASIVQTCQSVSMRKLAIDSEHRLSSFARVRVSDVSPSRDRTGDWLPGGKASLRQRPR